MTGQREYRRNLPHIQKEGKTFFITFCTRGGKGLPPSARDIVLQSCVRIHGDEAFLHAAVVMPDHVHLILTPLMNRAGEYPILERILKSIKGTSARKVNQRLGRRGTVWQSESFDHVLRSTESAEEKARYVSMNPVRKGLVKKPEEYPWMWRRQQAE